MTPSTVKVNNPCSSVSRSVLIIYGVVLMLSFAHILKPYEIFKHGLLCVAKANDCEPCTEMYIESHSLLCTSLTYEARNDTNDFTKTRGLISDFWHDNNATTDNNNNFFIIR